MERRDSEEALRMRKPTRRHEASQNTTEHSTHSHMIFKPADGDKRTSNELAIQRSPLAPIRRSHPPTRADTPSLALLRNVGERNLNLAFSGDREKTECDSEGVR
ncbi:unnamed protein product [Pleuronectes platessa]|uniref:Uncharacterized protein n=1 Tax=Pleuronectes platessa TaxID=8262 RepID=A0A9N7VY95_PLEPL|nr:unnamed protein product [Pleuronectes platessa]